MILYVLEAVAMVCEQKNTSILIGHEAEKVKEAVQSNVVNFIHQGEQFGTGHGVFVAWEMLQHKNIEYLLVINGDVPLLNHQYLSQLIEYTTKNNIDLAFLTTLVEDTSEYGIVLRKNGVVTCIVESKDFDSSIHNESKEINTGIYLFSMKTIAPLLSKLDNQNAKGEYYITQLVDLAVQDGLKVEGVCVENTESLLGVNTPFELVEAEEILREHICVYWLMRGVHIHNYMGVSISPTVTIEPGVIINGPCTITGKTTIHANVVIEPYCVIHDTILYPNTRIRSFSHLEGASVGEESRVGPFSRLRPEVFLGNRTRIGNFVEIKKSTIGSDVAINHLSYIGDATIGEKTNVGAGTITCNYDGNQKHDTIIGSNVFIGSITALIAPVTIEDNSTIGAGSVITKNVKANTLALSRSEQKSWQKK